jgi:hypothetical protein
MGFHHRVTSDGQWWSKQRAGSETTTNSQKMEAPRGPRPSCRGCTSYMVFPCSYSTVRTNEAPWWIGGTAPRERSGLWAPDHRGCHGPTHPGPVTWESTGGNCASSHTIRVLVQYSVRMAARRQ